MSSLSKRLTSTRNLHWLAALLIAGLLLSALVVPVLAADFYRTCSITGGSPQRLSTVLAANGYTGTVTVDELTICNPVGAANTLYVGRSDVSATNGVPFPAGACYTSRAEIGRPILPEQIYFYRAATADAGLIVRGQ